MNSTSPLVSVVVPVYNVQGQVRKCLKSILGQSYRNLEVIIVNDCSTDNSLAICQEVLSDTPDCMFSKIISHEKNSGLGAARNTGIASATGDYILFVDSDDWIERHLISVVLHNAEAHNSDIVIFNHARVWPSGRSSVNWRSDLFAKFAGKELSLKDRIEVFQNLNVAWNKLYRRSFIKAQDLCFGEGYYEDIPWTYYILACDIKITLDNYVGYFYYQRPGSILNSTTEKHFEIFDRYSELFDRLISSPVKIEYRNEVFFRFVEHVVNLCFEHDNRIPRHSLTRFASQAAVEIRGAADKFGYDLNSFHFHRDPRLRRRYPVLMASSPAVFQLFRKTRRVVRGLVLLKAKLQRYYQKLLARICSFLFPKIYKFLLAKLPIKGNVAVFSAYWDGQIACNPKAISDKLAMDRPKIVQYWILKDKRKAPPGYTVIKPYSFKYYYVMAVAKYFISNTNFPNFLIKRSRQIHLQTKHGTPIKKMGFDLIRESKANDMSPDLFQERCSRWDYVISSNAYSSEIWTGGFPFNYKLLESGYPRNDKLIQSAPDERQKVRHALGIPEDAFVILYMPTFRDYDRSHTPQLDAISLLQSAGKNAYLLSRIHYFKQGKPAALSKYNQNIIYVDEYPEVEDLYLAANLLVSDYSSSMFDYLNLARPLFSFGYDYDKYSEYRGIYLDLRKEFGVLFCETQAELEEKIERARNGDLEIHEKIENLREKYVSWDDGNSSGRVVEAVFQD